MMFSKNSMTFTALKLNFTFLKLNFTFLKLNFTALKLNLLKNSMAFQPLSSLGRLPVFTLNFAEK